MFRKRLNKLPNYAQRLRYARRFNGMTIYQMKLKLGLHRAQWSRFECGVVKPSPLLYKQISSILGFTFEWLTEDSPLPDYATL